MSENVPDSQRMESFADALLCALSNSDWELTLKVSAFRFAVFANRKMQRMDKYKFFIVFCLLGIGYLRDVGFLLVNFFYCNRLFVCVRLFKFPNLNKTKLGVS